MSVSVVTCAAERRFVRAGLVDLTLSSLIASADGGDRSAADALFAALYSELHRIAGRQLARGAGGLTLGTTTLLHEAYLDMAVRDGVVFADRGRFMGYAARVMRGLDHRLRCATARPTSAAASSRSRPSSATCRMRRPTPPERRADPHRRRARRAGHRGAPARAGGGPEVLLRLLVRRDRGHARPLRAHGPAALGEGAHLPARRPGAGGAALDGLGHASRLGPLRWRAVRPYLDRALEMAAEERDLWLDSLRHR